MKTISFTRIALFGLTVALCLSCVKDLDTLPLDTNKLVGEEIYKTANGYRGVLAKCYSSLILTGQKGGDSGDGDVPGIDEGYSGYSRALFYLQVGTTDEILVQSGSGHGTRDMLYTNWNPSTKVLSYPYYRLYMAIGYCNEFLRESTEEKLQKRGVYEELKGELSYYQAEARFIRAYCYSMICDLYGAVPFIDETMPIGTIPRQRTREEIYNYVVSEGEALSVALKAPKTNQYGRVDQVAAWFLLSRVYLNAETWIGKKENEKAYQFAKKIIENGKYPLASDYRHIFLADNNTCSEIIWPLVQDADNAQSSAGTNFQIKALIDGPMNNFYKTGVGARGWGNARVKTQLVDLFELSDQTFKPLDTWGDTKKDKRAQFFSIGKTKETWAVNKAFQNDFNSGYACIKWRNVTKNREELVAGGTVYSSVDFPIFRTADAYLMAAEAILRGASGTRTEALNFVNTIRDRAYMSGAFGTGATGRIDDNKLTLDFILDERGRELHTELTRRTDLIRFNKFTKGYNWDWKGSDGLAGNFKGKDVDDKYKLFPIPQDEFTVNPYLTQNPNFK